MRVLGSLLTGIFMLTGLAFAEAPVTPALKTEKTDCPYNSDIFALGIEAFDQDMNGGWRKIASKAGCEAAAADLIKRYRELVQGRMGMLYWHEAQLRATSGDKPAAILLMRKSVKQNDEGFGWNDYVEASIAFLESNRVKLLSARERLALLPAPTGRRCVDTKGQTIDCGVWPPNLDVVDGFVNCFTKSYSEAYGLDCRRAIISDQHANGATN